MQKQKQAGGLNTLQCARESCTDNSLYVQEQKQAVGLQLQEPWLREHQVLPGRSHPMMSMQGTGGYLLSGIKVLP